MIFQIHDYFNNNEFDTDNSYDWMISKESQRQLWCAAVPGFNCSQIINGEFNDYDYPGPGGMTANGQQYKHVNLLALLYTAQHLHVHENWTIIHYEWTTQGNRTHEEGQWPYRYYNMVSDPLLDNTTTKVYEAYQDFSWYIQRGNSVVTANADDNDVKAACNYSPTSVYRCLVANKGSSTETATIDITGLGSGYNVTAAVNGRNGTVYSVSTATGGGVVTVGNMPQYDTVLLNLTITANDEGEPEPPSPTTTGLGIVKNGLLMIKNGLLVLI
jgi:hypothetical protein